MKQITEYLLGKNNSNIADKYYLVLPGNKPYLEISKKYSSEVLHQHKISSFDYWVFPSSKLLEILEPFEDGIKSKTYEYLLRIWEVPEKYGNDIERFKKDFEDSDIYPDKYLKKINYDDII